MMDIMRFTGIASGMDTENTIKQLTRSHQIRIDRVEQDKQTAEWQRDEFRNISNQVRVFRDDYFNFVNPENNMRAAATFSAFDVSYNGEDSSNYLTVQTTAGAVDSSFNISDIQMATQAKAESETMVTGDIIANQLTEDLNITEDNNRFLIDFNNVTKSIILDEGSYHIDPQEGQKGFNDLVNDLQSEIDQSFGEDRVQVELIGDQIKISETSLDQTNFLSLRPVSGNSGLEAIGFGEGTNLSNRMNLNLNLEEIANSFTSELITAEGEDIVFNINGTEFAFDSSEDTLDNIITTINNSNAGVTIRYNNLNDQFMIESDDVGITEGINISESQGNLMALIGLNDTNQSGTDASIIIDGKTVTRSSNSFTLDGIRFELNNNYSGVEDINISVEPNSEQVAEKIISFVEDYNQLISTINSKLNEPVHRDFRPLTAEQKEAMSDREIELWEEKAQSGLLRRDSLLQRMVTNMRTVMFQSPDGVDISLFDLGINTSSNYLEAGKLIIDENQLKETIAENPQGVIDLFTQRSEDNPEENGLSSRLYDILENNIRTTRDNRGRKGLLLEKAGIEGDTTEINNQLNRQIINYDNRINTLLETMNRQEEYYYNMFARMESALQEMYAQSDWLTAQLGQMNQ